MESLSCAKKGRQKVFNLSTGQSASCCRAHQQALDADFSLSRLIDIWQQESLQLDQGRRLPGCVGCWKDEDQQQISYRQLEPNYDLNNFEIVMSNLCNHMCSYCSPMFSSQWQNSIQEQGKFKEIPLTDANRLTAQFKEIDPEIFLNQFENYLSTVPNGSVTVRLLGGEPLMQADSLRKIFVIRPDKIASIDIITNLNPPTPKFLEWIIETQHNRLNRVHFMISIDATPEYNAVVRAGFDPTRFNQNLQSLKTNNIGHTIYATVSLLSLFDLPNFTRYLAEQKVNWHLTPVNHPVSLSPDIVPRSIRQQILQTSVNLPKHIVEILNLPDSNDLKLLSAFRYLEQYFARTDQDPKCINNLLFQEFWNHCQLKLAKWLT
jgi:hypothetical protein